MGQACTVSRMLMQLAPQQTSSVGQQSPSPACMLRCDKLSVAKKWDIQWLTCKSVKVAGGSLRSAPESARSF
jgi:hypothetical protein